MMKKQSTKYLIWILAYILLQSNVFGQTVSWGPTIPAVSSDNINTCFEEGAMTFEFTNASTPMQDVSIEVQLDTGVYYVPGSFSYTSSNNTTVIEDDISNLNRPTFWVGRFLPGRQITMTIDRTADCEAMAQNISGSTFIDSVHIYDDGTEVSYTNGIANGTVNYEILYGLLSITSVSTSPGVINFGSTATRSMTITNGAFGSIQEFYIADVFGGGELTLSNFRINPSGVNHIIPSGNISTVGDSVIVQFSASEIMGIDGSAGTKGDGDGIFDGDESFVLSYDVTPNVCGLNNSISSEIIGWFGCSYDDRCQVIESAATITLTNATPVLDFSNAVRPRLDFCDTVIYSVTITNNTPETSPAGAAYAKDVTAILGLRSNNTPIATLDNNGQWGTAVRNVKYFTGHTLNGISVALPTTTGNNGTTMPYLPPDYFTSDPDGPGGLTDVDNDGFYDDLPKDASLVISYGVYIQPRDGICGAGRYDYITWEHISADVSWFNDCDLLMSPIRQEFNYTNHIREYLNSTFTNAPTDIVDGQIFDVGIRPHLYSTIDCNGESGTTGSNMDWITQIVLPSGVTMAPGYNTSIYTVVGNVVTTTAKYAYTWTNFPLEFDCDSWDGSDLIIPISTTYVCNGDGGICFEEEMHCVDIEMTPQCIGDCVGISPLNFSTDRISESWTNSAKTDLVDLSDPSIVTNYVYPFDTVDLYAEGVFTDTMSDQLFLRIKYSPENGGNIFLYEEGTIEISDIDGQYNGGQTKYTVPLTSPPTVNSLGGNDFEMIFDLSSYRTAVNANYYYGQSASSPTIFDADTVRVSAKVVISNTMTPTTPHKVDSLRSEFFMQDAAGDDILCGSWGSELFYEYPIVRPSNSYQNSSGCFGYRKRFYITHASESGDNFPNEYRPPIYLDSAIVVLPEGWYVEDVGWINNVVMDPSDYEFRSDGTLIIRRPAGYTDYDKVGNVYRSFFVDLTADCRAPDGNNNFRYSAFYKEFAYLTDESSHNSRTISGNSGGLNYTPPTFSIIPIVQTVTAYTDTVQWKIRVCNNTSDMDVAYNWLTLENMGNLISVDSVMDITGSGSVILNSSTLPSGGTYVELGALDQGSCTDLIIFSSSSSCQRDSLNLSHGWSCSEYPSLSEVVTCGVQNELYILPQFAQITSSITPLATTPINPSNPSGGDWGSSPVDMCSEFPMELTVVNSQPGSLYDLIVNMSIPSLGSGLTYVSGSATIEVEGLDAPNTSRTIGPAAEAALVTASSNGDPNWAVTLAQLDPANYSGGSGLSGTSNSANNQFILRWEMESTCDLVSGDFVSIVIDGNDPCGSSANGSTEQIQSYPININGATPPYFSFFTSTISPNDSFEGCEDLKTVGLNILISGGSTGSQDTLEVILPPGLGYAGGYNCTTPGNCPIYIGTSIVGDDEVSKFSYPSGVTGTSDFTFDVDTDSRGVCTPNDNISFINKVSIGGLVCGSVSCPSTRVITGSDILPISLTKPILTVDYNSLTVFRGNTNNLFYYDLNLTNTGIATENNVIVEFYCLNATGNDIMGSAVAADTLTSLLFNGTSSNLSGEFKASCDPENGIGVLIVPEYDNCYCGALESMGNKSSGLTEIPHDILTDIPPFSCRTAMTNPQVSFRMMRNID